MQDATKVNSAVTAMLHTPKPHTFPRHDSKTPEGYNNHFGQETHSLRGRSVEPEGRRGAHHGRGGSEAPVKPRDDAPAMRGQYCERKAKDRKSVV